jgi:hypothetical protein
VIEDGWKLIAPAKPNESGEPELYRVRVDEGERKDLAGEQPGRVAEVVAEIG